jgi:hypothetical protein
VADVDRDAQLGAARHEPPTVLGESRSGVGRGRKAERHAVAEGVGTAPHRSERANPGGVPGVERGQIGADGLGTLEVQPDGQRAVGARPVELLDAAHDRHRPVARGCQRVRPPDRAEGEDRRVGGVDRVGVALLPGRAVDVQVARRRGGVDREQAAGEAAGASARQVDIALRQAGQEALRWIVGRLQRAQRVVVAVEDGGQVSSRSIHLCIGAGCQRSRVSSRPSKSSATASISRVSRRRKRWATAWSRKAASGS